MRLEAVTCCVGYADFLQVTAQYNQRLFDRWVIVTAPDDQETRALCHRLGLPCVLTEDWTNRGDPFNKGRGVQRGFTQLAMTDWVLHLDADIALAALTRQFLESAHLDPTILYGCDRVMVKGWDAWIKLRNSGYLDQGQHDYHCRVNFPAGYDVGSRWANSHDGYHPIGFFALAHGSEIVKNGIFQRHYPPHHSDAARGDVQFASMFDRRKRQLLPEIIAVHLESEVDSKLGANWRGRTTKPFRPRPCPPHPHPHPCPGPS